MGRIYGEDSDLLQRVLQQGRPGRRRSGQSGRSLRENAHDRARHLLQVQQGYDRGLLRGLNFKPLDGLMARKSVLGMATIFRLIEFVDEVFQVIEFIGRDFLKFDAKRLLVDPLHRRLRNRQRFL